MFLPSIHKPSLYTSYHRSLITTLNRSFIQTGNDLSNKIALNHENLHAHIIGQPSFHTHPSPPSQILPTFAPENTTIAFRLLAQDTDGVHAEDGKIFRIVVGKEAEKFYGTVVYFISLGAEVKAFFRGAGGKTTDDALENLFVASAEVVAHAGEELCGKHKALPGGGSFDEAPGC